jgi:hypothetical protein
LKRLVLGIAAIALVAAACGDSADSPEQIAAEPGGDVTTTVPSDSDPEPAPVDDTVPGPKRDNPDLLPGLPSAVAATELAERLGVEVADITVNVVENVMWRDGSIGCPEPGMSYTQALVPGVRVILEHGNQFYYYHGTAADNLFYCENPGDPVAGDQDLIEHFAPPPSNSPSNDAALGAFLCHQHPEVAEAPRM